MVADETHRCGVLVATKGVKYFAAMEQNLGVTPRIRAPREPLVSKYTPREDSPLSRKSAAKNIKVNMLTDWWLKLNSLPAAVASALKHQHLFGVVWRSKLLKKLSQSWSVSLRGVVRTRSFIAVSVKGVALCFGHARWYSHPVYRLRASPFVVIIDLLIYINPRTRGASPPSCCHDLRRVNL